MKCVVYNCKNDRNNKEAKKTFFHFPTEKTQLKKWLKFCRNSDIFKPKTWRICIDHFNDEDICGNEMYKLGYAMKRTLKRGAVPCRYNVTNIDLERAERMKKRENKKIVASLLMDSGNQTERMKTGKIEIEAPLNQDVHLPIEINNEFEGKTNNCTEDSNEERKQMKSSQEDNIKMIEKEKNLLKRENRILKDELWRIKRKNEHEINELKKKLARSEVQRKNIEDKLKGIFSDGQLNKLKIGTKKQNCTHANNKFIFCQ